MPLTPCNWIEEDKVLVQQKIADRMVQGLPREVIEALASQRLVVKLSDLDWSELWAEADNWAPEILDFLRPEGDTIDGSPSF